MSIALTHEVQVLRERVAQLEDTVQRLANILAGNEKTLDALETLLTAPQPQRVRR